jgi:hypothetical protein
MCLCALIYVSVKAQVTDFKLSDYKYRTPLYQSLQLDLDLKQSSSSGEDTKGLQASFDAFISYLKIYATDKRQHISLTSAFMQPRFGSSKQGDIKNLNNGMSGGLRYSSQDRIYKDNHFIELGGAAGGNTFSRKTGQKGKATTQADQHAYLELNVGIGRGRLEYVHDAQAALLLLEDLYANGIIKSRVDAETANRFAQLITNIKKQRVLDARRRNIYKLTQVDSFLRVNKIIPQCDARTMAIINDVLFFSFQNDLSDYVNTYQDPVDFSFNRGNFDEGFESTDYAFIPQLEALTDQTFRQHGTIMYARLVPELRYDQFKTKIQKPAGGDSTDKSTYAYASPGIRLGFEKHQAISLKWQKNYRAGLGYVYRNYITSKPNPNTNYNVIEANLNYEIGYYPNSRSVIEANADIDVSRYGGGLKATFITPGIGLNAGYFISYNTVLRASFFANYMIQRGDTKESMLSQGLRIYLRHYFF